MQNPIQQFRGISALLTGKGARNAASWLCLALLSVHEPVLGQEAATPDTAAADSGEKPAGKKQAGEGAARESNGRDSSAADASAANGEAVEPAPDGGGEVEAAKAYIREFRVKGSKLLSQQEIGETVYPFLGPERTLADVENARAALEKAYQSKGYSTVQVSVPPQTFYRGIVRLEVAELTVGRLRVRGSRYFAIDRIKKNAPSLAEGKVINFQDVERDIIALNQHPDRRVTPKILPGSLPGTLNVDLEVKDKFPLHGSLELNNRYSPDTTPLRVNGGLAYSNLWQQGHSAGINFQIAPENLEDARVLSGYYLMRFDSMPKTNLMLQGVWQDSNVSTLGGTAVAGRGYVFGARVLWNLPTKKDFFHNLSFGVDWKSFDEDVTYAGTETATPIEYFPASLNYGASWLKDDSATDLNAGLVMGLRGAGSDPLEFDAKRYNATASFFYFRGDLSRSQDLPAGFQAFAKVQGQWASQPLINSEQYSGGGLQNARGYLESTALGDNGIFGTLELRSPSFLRKRKVTDPAGNPVLDEQGREVLKVDRGNEWRVYAFVDAGRLTINDPLPEQEDVIDLASIGFGTRFRIFDCLNGSFDAGLPLKSREADGSKDWLFTFRAWADF